MNRKISFGLTAFILFLILFDAFQQKYYLESFNLLPEGEVLSLAYLLKQHSIRWIIWALISVPSSFLIWKELIRNKRALPSQSIFRISTVIVLTILISITAVSIQSIFHQGLNIESNTLYEFFVFFIFQKGLTFLMASITVALILYNQSSEQTIESQFVEIKNLERKSTDLEEALNMSSKSEPHLNIKIGHRFQPIPLNEIVWIQSDDYCVKVHTEDKAFSFRKSMKSLEEQLSRYGFIRVHRAALLNLNFLHQVNFDSSTIELSNTTQLPLSKTGAKALKQKLEQDAI
ncbi:LytR/AlgR family response regulator transcription factor [Ekhidna sp.]